MKIAQIWAKTAQNRAKIGRKWAKRVKIGRKVWHKRKLDENERELNEKCGTSRATTTTIELLTIENLPMLTIENVMCDRCFAS